MKTLTIEQLQEIITQQDAIITQQETALDHFQKIHEYLTSQNHLLVKLGTVVPDSDHPTKTEDDYLRIGTIITDPSTFEQTFFLEPNIDTSHFPQVYPEHTVKCITTCKLPKFY